MSQAAPISLRELCLTFLKIGLTAFGGGMAIVALTERVVVHEKQWIKPEEFLHGLAFGQIIGPFSLNTCTFVGYRLRGVMGGILAAICFLIPSFAIVTGLAWAYLQFRHLDLLKKALHATNPVIVALICSVVLDMGRKQIKDLTTMVVAVAACLLVAIAKAPISLVLLGAAVWALAYAVYQRGR